MILTETNLDFQHKKVLIIGDVMLDKFIETTFEKISPEYQHTEILKTISEKNYLGGAANVANNIRQLGAIPYLVGVVGNDVNAAIFTELATEKNMSTEFIIRTNIRTTTKSRFFKNGLPLLRIDNEVSEDYNETLNQQILENMLGIIEKYQPDAIVLEDYNKGVLNIITIPEILKIAIRENIPVFVDPKFSNWNLYQNVKVFKPNWDEFCRIVQELKIENLESEKQFLRVKQELNTENLFITKGKNGNIIVDDKNNIHKFSVYKTIKHSDVCGAGDSVIAIICLSTLAKNDIATTARLANIAGFIACSNQHVYAVKSEDISLLLSQFQ